jgi:hypothetical protein
LVSDVGAARAAMPPRDEQTTREMRAAQDPYRAVHAPPGQDTQALIADSDARLAPTRAAGMDTYLFTLWIET